jgi:hypothetical protein
MPTLLDVQAIKPSHKNVLLQHSMQTSGTIWNMRRKERATHLLIKKSTHCRKRKRITIKEKKRRPTTKKA